MVTKADIPKGYKQTEVGVIPYDWEVGKIKDHASIITGSRNTQDKIDDGAYPFFVRSQKVEHINSFSYDGEAVLTAGDGVGTGKIFHYINGKFDYHQRVYKISEFSENLDGYYFYLYFSNNFYDRIMSMTAKSSVDSVRMEMIAGMHLPLPPKVEQQAIAEALSDVDGLIGSMDALISKKRQIKQGTMQQLLTGKKRLPGFSGEWEELPFNEIFKKHPAKNFQIQSNQYHSSGIFPIIDQGKKRIVAYSDDKSKVFNCPDNGVIIFGDHTREFKYIDFNFVIGADGTQILSTKEEFCEKFFYYLLITKKIPNTGYNRHFKFLKEMLFRFPLLEEEQIAIAGVISDMDTEIEVLEQKRDKYIIIKQGMMQTLLTGRIRLV